MAIEYADNESFKEQINYKDGDTLELRYGDTFIEIK